ncbi:F0F1 ATP synthase subunit gamma [Neorickettsia sp. 179522]|uniref:F0F1 ATP synthase subunit gamma n=1 Tax=Neorickettsia sp. 179522 TaxID=1714371 RepID=UPI0009EE21A5|nr:FoF1 ATP synthase subunit gamma [Neorickettsia sp. 179522]
MSNLKSLLLRINSVNSTKKITRVMQMIATSKLKQARTSLVAARRYRDEVLRSLEIFGKFREEVSSSDVPAQGDVLVAFSADRGLCGGYNSSLIRHLRSLANEFKDSGATFCFIGKKISFFAEQFRSARTNTSGSDDVDFCFFNKLVTSLGSNAVFRCLYTKCESVMNMHSVLLRIPAASDFLFHDVCTSHLEPENKKLFTSLYVQYVCTQLYVCLREAKVSENMSRMLAMDGATKNAQEVGDKLRRRYNSARQEKITKELIEVISGAEVI